MNRQQLLCEHMPLDVAKIVEEYSMGYHIVWQKSLMKDVFEELDAFHRFFNDNPNYLRLEPRKIYYSAKYVENYYSSLAKHLKLFRATMWVIDIVCSCDKPDTRYQRHEFMIISDRRYIISKKGYWYIYNNLR